MIVRINPDKIIVSSRKVWRRLGHRGDAVEGRLERIIMEKEKVFRHYLEPRIYFQENFVISRDDRSVWLENGLSIQSQRIAQLLANSPIAVLFLITIGDRLENEVNRLMGEGKLTEATVLDFFGSEAVEKALDLFQQAFSSAVKSQNGEITSRFSPGYGDWELAAQADLFRYLDHKAIGVNLTSSFYMLPRKSVSGLFGASKKIPADFVFDL